MSSTLDSEHSIWWYAAPILGGLIGGLIAFFALREDAPHMSKYCILVGIIFEIIAVAILNVLGINCLALFNF